ncbi:MAG: hypothetical protein KC445_18315, partial [Anaerolineales bacterium]|nr:hypothetical protein [Anaerolineales bacterium]
MTNMKTPIYQYSKKNNEKVFRYSSDKSLADSTWAKDDVAFYASNKPAENLVPVYEYHAGSDSSFRYLYTTDPNASQGWKNEAGNIAFYASATEMPNTTPIILFHKESNGWYFRYSAYEQVDNDWTVNPTPVFYASAPAPNRVQINKGGYVSIPHNEAYNFGKGAFSVMAYITPNKVENGQTELTAGTIVSSKPQPGGNGNGGWQFFLEKEGEALMLCFKTDDGHGYHLLKAPLNNLYD